MRSDIEWNVAQRRSKITKMAEGTLKTLTKALERVKAQIRARVEHLFHVIKNLFHYKKGSLKGSGQERGAVVQPLRLGQPRHRQENPARNGVTRHWCALSADKVPHMGQNKVLGPRINMNLR